ncbi:MAG: transglycosylase SLT domain-containing protein [Nitrospirae bacterium]|nr:transglycosylase SLT domain-containing protein [Nitrospirota bacterium]
MKRIILCIVMFFCFTAHVHADETNARTILISAKNEFDSGRYAVASEHLKEAYKKLPVIGDYILLWLSTAHRELGNFDESNSTIKELLKHYPDSLLRKNARNLELKNIIGSKNNIPATGDSDDAEASRTKLHAFESYVKDYPEDYEIKFLYAQLLAKQGMAEKAKQIYRNIYINSENRFSKLAINELSPSDITLQDIIEKASNLIDTMGYPTAESLLRKALLRDDVKHRREILKKLGLSLFKQKKYRESAEIYEKAGDLYARARALYRAGDKTELDTAVKKLASMGDSRTGSFLTLIASDKRRNGEIDEALSIYNDVKAKYPSETEYTLWEIGWTYYLTGDYQKALSAFTELSNTYSGSKYLYWKAQSLEKLGKASDNIYKQFLEKQQDFYAVLVQIKYSNQSPLATRSPRRLLGDPPEAGILPSADQGEKSEFSAQKSSLDQEGSDTKISESLKASDLQDSKSPELKPFRSERIDLLMELGMKKEAAAELSAIAKKATAPYEVMSISVRLQEAGEYKLALNLAARLPYREPAHGILYPLAHWPVVSKVSEKYGVDPLIVLSVMREESHFDSEARSHVGALGLMQLMPQTAYAIDRRINLGIKSQEQLYDVQVNIALGSYYINTLIKEFNSIPAAIASYNAGEDIVRKWLKTGNYRSYDEFIEDIPYEETRNFTKRVITTYFEYYRSSGEKGIPKML